MTAYGLLQFRDMARVTDVDPTLLKRTSAYLLSRRDGQGGFTRNPRALDTFGRAPQDVTTAYIIWAITESGKEEDVTRELNKLAEQAQTTKDPYFLALVANAHVVASLPNGLTVEMDQTGNALIDQILVEPLAVRDGILRLPDGPGLGIALDEAAIARLAVPASASVVDGNYSDMVFGAGYLGVTPPYRPAIPATADAR